MKSSFQYGGYVISNGGGVFVANSADDVQCELRSQCLLRVIRAIDTLWDALDRQTFPTWLLAWIEDPAASIDLDTAADAVALAEPCSKSHDDPIKALSFPGKPLQVTIGRAAAAVAAAIAPTPSAIGSAAA